MPVGPESGLHPKCSVTVLQRTPSICILATFYLLEMKHCHYFLINLVEPHGVRDQDWLKNISIDTKCSCTIVSNSQQSSWYLHKYKRLSTFAFYTYFLYWFNNFIEFQLNWWGLGKITLICLWKFTNSKSYITG
jgi:hypothetical protein